MRLERLLLAGAYGRIGTNAEIEPVTVILGNNEAGKTTLLEAVTYAVNGPPRGGGFGPDWNALLFFDDDPVQVGRSVVAGKQTAVVRGRALGPREGQRLIDQALGRASTWSLASFLELSEAKRLDWLEAEVLDGAGWDWDRLRKEIDDSGDVTMRGLAEAPEDDETPRGWLSRLTTKLKQDAKDADVDARRLAKAIEQAETEFGEAQRESVDTGGTVASWRAKRDDIDTKIQSQQQYIGKLRGLEESRQRIETTQERLWKDIQALQSKDWDAARDQLEQEVGKRERQVETARAALNESKEAQPVRTVQVNDLEREHEEAENTLRSIDEAIEVNTAEVMALQRVQGLVDLLRALECEAGLSDEWAAKVRTMLEGVDTSVNERPKELGKKQLEAIEKVDGIAQRLEAARRIAQRIEEAVMAGSQAYNNALADADDAKLAVDMFDQERLTFGERLAKLTDEYESMTQQVIEIGNTDTTTAEESLDALNTERADIQKNLDKLSDAQGAMAGLAEHRQALNDAKTARTKAREQLKALQPILDRFMVGLFGELRGDISRLTEAVLGATWYPDVEGGFAFYMKRKDTDLGPGSRSAKAVALAGLRIAVGERLKGWRHFILDDVENLQQPRRNALVAALVEEVEAGRLDNAILACVDDGWEPACHVVRL